MADYVPAYTASFPVCSVNILTYKSFTFTDLTTGGGQLGKEDFGVTPDESTGALNFSIPGGTYNNEKYFISYIVDPAPVLGGEELSLDLLGSDFFAFAFFLFDEEVLEPAVEPTATISKWACPAGLLGGLPPDVGGTIGADSLSCTSEMFFLQVDEGNPNDSATFPSLVAFTHVGILFELDGELGGIGVGSTPIIVTETPEPGTSLMLAGGLMALLAARRYKR